VGTNAVVTRDVEAYAIVAGAPARVLRRRFPEAVSARIEALEWWDWPQEKIAAAVPDMQELGIEAFLDKWE
jgi:serine acetyltransferase